MIANPLEFLHGECREMVQKEKRQGEWGVGNIYILDWVG